MAPLSLGINVEFKFRLNRGFVAKLHTCAKPGSLMPHAPHSFTPFLLDTGSGAVECWPYRSAFKAGQVVSLTSNCNVTSQWTPTGTNLPEQQSMPERG